MSLFAVSIFVSIQEISLRPFPVSSVAGPEKRYQFFENKKVQKMEENLFLRLFGLLSLLHRCVADKLLETLVPR